MGCSRRAAAQRRRVRACARASGLLPGLSGPAHRPLRTGHQDALTIAPRRAPDSRAGPGRLLGRRASPSPGRPLRRGDLRGGLRTGRSSRGRPRRAARGSRRGCGAACWSAAIASPRPTPPNGAPGAR
jgi:hypothetical protein